MSSGVFSSVNLIAGAGILGNVGGNPIGVSPELSNAVATYYSVPAVGRFQAIVAQGYSNVYIAGNAFPALTNSVPPAYQAQLGNNVSMTGAINVANDQILGNGDLGKFEQVFSLSQAYVTQTNQMLKTMFNATSPNNTTGYTTQDNLSTGGLSSVSQAFAAFGADLKQLGVAIDLSNLNNLGDPVALLQQLNTVASNTPALNDALLAVGLPASLVSDPINSTYTLQQQHLVYLAMTRITGQDLQDVLTLLHVTTPGLETMADLLNPLKTFPRSYTTLTAPTASGLRAIYINSAGAVNSNLATQLPPNVLAPLNGNPLQNLPASKT